MSEKRTLSIALPLETFQYGEGKSKTGFRAVDRHSGQKYVVFDAKVAEAIRSVGEASRDYDVRPANEPGRDAIINGVPGVYEPAPRFPAGGGGFRGGGGGGMSNKQVALLAASNLAPAGSQVAVVTAYAEKLLVWLVGGGESQAPAATQAAPAAAPAPQLTPPPAAAPAAPTTAQGWSAPPVVEVPADPVAAAGAFIEGIGGGEDEWN